MSVPPVVYGARTIKRDRRTRARIEQLDAQILDVLGEDHPQSVRHVFYRLTDPRLPEPVEKSERGYRHVQRRIVELRRAGRLAYGWITDTTRRGYFTTTYSGKADFLRRMVGLYRADMWSLADRYCEVWCESRSIAGVIQETCEELAVSLYPAGGFSSLTLPYEAAEFITAVGKPTTIFYIGDHDAAGVLIDRAIERELRRHLGEDFDLSFVRLGITPEQIAALGLPVKPRKTGDKRSKHVTGAVEAEAMPAHILRALLRDAIEALLPVGALEVARAAEESEREGLQALADALEGGE